MELGLYSAQNLTELVSHPALPESPPLGQIITLPFPVAFIWGSQGPH